MDFIDGTAPSLGHTFITHPKSQTNQTHKAFECMCAEPCVYVFVAILVLKFFNYCPKLIIQQCYKRIKSKSQSQSESNVSKYQ